MMKGRRGSQETIDRDTLKELETKGEILVWREFCVLSRGCMGLRDTFLSISGLAWKDSNFSTSEHCCCVLKKTSTRLKTEVSALIGNYVVVSNGRNYGMTC